MTKVTSSKTIATDEVADIISAILTDYAQDVQDVIRENADEVSKEGKRKLIGTSPVGNRGKYKKGWKVAKKDGYTYTNRTLHNLTDYQLTHLLEKGHATRNGGRTKAIPHIAPVDEWCNEEYYKRVKEGINGIE